MTYDAPKIVWSIEEFLTEGSNIMFYGETGHGKSIGALYLACCVAAGHPYFDRQVKPGPVAYMQEDQTNIGLDITRAKHFLSPLHRPGDRDMENKLAVLAPARV